MVQRTHEIARPYAAIEVARQISRLIEEAKPVEFTRPDEAVIRPSWGSRREYDKIPS